jgi:ribosomal protein L5
MALEPSLAQISKAKNTVKRYTLRSAIPIGANTMFLQVGKRYALF